MTNKKIDAMAQQKVKNVIFDILFTEFLEHDDAKRASGMIFDALNKPLIEVMRTAEKLEAEDICVIIDKIEATSDTNTLEEWKQYKAIRNAIRDKYILKSAD